MFIIQEPTKPEIIVGATKLTEELGELLTATAKHVNTCNTDLPSDTRAAFLAELADVIAICNFVTSQTPMTEREWKGLWDRVSSKTRKYNAWHDVAGVEVAMIRTPEESDVTFYTCHGKHRGEP